MLSSPSSRQENRVKRLDLSGLSFKTISPRNLISPKKSPSEKDSDIKGVPLERCLTTVTQPTVPPVIPVDRAFSLDRAVFSSLKHEPSKFKPIENVIYEDGRNFNEERYALPTPSSAKSTRPKNNSVSIHHSKELHNQPVLGIRGSEIPNNGVKSPVSHEPPLNLGGRRKKTKMGLSMIVKPNEEFLQKAKGYMKIESPKSPQQISFSPRVGSLASLGSRNMSQSQLPGLQHVFSARQSTQQTEEVFRMKTEAFERFKDDVENGFNNGGELKDSKGFHKVSTNLQCFLDTKMTWKGSLMKKPQYSLYQNIAQNRKARNFRLTSVDVIKGFCRGVPAKI